MPRCQFLLPPWVAFPLLALLGGCALSAQLPPMSANPFDGAAGTVWVLPKTTVRLVNTAPSFGPYQVSGLHRGWTHTRTRQGWLLPGPTGSVLLDLLSRPYAQRATASRTRSQFHLADDQGRAAEVYATTESLTQERQLSPTLGEGLTGTETFSAILTGPRVGGTSTWFLRLAPPTGPLTTSAADAGLVGDSAQVLLRLRHLPHPPLVLPSGRRVPWPATYLPGSTTLPWAAAGRAGGLEVRYQEQRVGYIDYATAHPSVWLRDDLPPDLRFLVATVLSTVLLNSSW